MQSGGGVKTNDTSTLNSLCGYAWVYVWEEKQRCTLSSFFFFGLCPQPPPSHTLALVQTAVWSVMKLWGEGGRGSFVSSAYWKCTVGFFPVWETIYAKLFPISHIYLIWLAASASSSVTILFASCTKLTCFQSLKTELSPG